jgi:RHS repeat-associated protein
VLVKKAAGGQTTVYAGQHYEKNVSTGQETRYYFFGAQRIAMRQGSSTVYWLLGDHLGSTSLTLNSSGTKTGELRYKAYGETRYTWGTTPTDHRFTDQLQDDYIKLYHMGARWYDSYINRWISPDTIIPDFTNPQSLNRFSYTLGNPLKYIDPTGHKEEGACSDPNGECIDDEIYKAYWAYCAENPGDPACEAGDPVELGFWFLVGVSGGILVQDLIVIGGGFLGQGVTKTIGWIGSLLCGDGDCTNEAQSIWKLDPFQRGVAAENAVGRSSFLSQNFPTIDRFQNGVVTSIKSIDLNAASYQDIRALSRTVTGYIDKMANYQGQPSAWAGVRIYPSQITARAVDLVIPATGGTAAQLAALQQLKQYAQSLNVTLNIIPLP